MCRVCGRMVRCIFDSMPSKTRPGITKRTFSTLKNSARPHSRTPHTSSNELLHNTMNIQAMPQMHLPPTFLLPLRAKLHQTTSHQSSTPSNQFENTNPSIPASLFRSTPSSSPPPSSPISLPSTPPLVLSSSLQRHLPNLTLQPPHYITAHLHSRPYLLNTGDTLRLPFHMHGVSPGDILRLTRASILGSRNYTLKAGITRPEMYDGKPSQNIQYLDERLFVCRACVLGVESGPLLIKEKTKRRNRKVKTVKSKHRHTMLKIVEVRVKTLEELRAEAGSVLLEEGGAEITQENS